MADDARFKRAHIWAAVRLYKSPEAPYGVVGTVDLGVTYISREFTDLALTLRGLRRATIPEGEEWPPADTVWATPAEVAAAGLNIPLADLTPDQQTNLTEATEAARLVVIDLVAEPFGIA